MTDYLQDIQERWATGELIARVDHLWLLREVERQRTLIEALRVAIERYQGHGIRVDGALLLSMIEYGNAEPGVHWHSSGFYRKSP